MMLQALAAYAERRQIEDPEFFDPDFRWEKAAWQVSVSKDGKLAGVIPLETQVGRRWVAKRIRRPYTDVNEISVRSLDKAKSYFLCDTLERVLLYEGPGQVSTVPLVLARYTYFRNAIRRAAAEGVASALLTTLSAFLDDTAQVAAARKAFSDEEAAPEDNVIFLVDGEDLLTHPEVMQYWRKERSKGTANSGAKAICLVSGQLSLCVQTANKIKGIGGQDAILISANEKAFCSYGLEKADNSPISVRAEGLVKAALDDLIAKSRNQGLVFNEVLYLHWSRQAIKSDPIDPVISGDAEAIERLINSVPRGRRVIALDECAYYALSLSGNGARIVVRDWLESTVPEVAENVCRWFNDLAVVDIHSDGLLVRRDFSMWSLLATTVLRKDGKPDFDKLPPQTGSEVLFAALRGSGTPLPQSILVAALKRQQLEQRKPTDKYDPKLNPARMALIKACLLRSPNRKETDTMTERLDTESKDPAYLCGQLFAVIGRLQLLALGRVGASIADRSYGGVATRPATTLGPVFTKLPPYLKKANTRFPGSGTNKQKEIEFLCARITKLGGFPKTLGLEEQGRFALGYYCQLAQYRADRAEAEAADTAATLPEETA